MKPAPRRIALHVLLFVVVLVVLSAVAIWLGLGPLVHSQAGLTVGIVNRRTTRSVARFSGARSCATIPLLHDSHADCSPRVRSSRCRGGGTSEAGSPGA